jgi:hypothetical protein
MIEDDCGLFQGTFWSVVSFDSIYLGNKEDNKNHRHNLPLVGNFNQNPAG